MPPFARAIAVIAGSLAIAACAGDSPVAPGPASAGVAFASAPAPLVTGQSSAVAVTLGGATTSVTWTSSDTTVLSVQPGATAGDRATATVIALKSGVAIVRASAGAAAASATIEVRPRVSALALFPRALFIAPDDSRPLVAVAHATAGTNASSGDIDSRDAGFASLGATWSSSDSGVARVDSLGHVTAMRSGTATISVTIDGAVSSAHVTVQAPTGHHLVIDLAADGTSDAVHEAASRAAARWSRVIASDLPSVDLSVAPGMCGAGTPAIHRTVDDILVIVRVDSIDGSGGAVAAATPCIVRDDWMPSVSVITVDSADLASLASAGRLDDVVAHEMGHALGVGMLWIVRQLVDGWGTSDPLFVGSATRQAAFDAGAIASADDSVPVENAGGKGTANEHWRAGAFGAELMTGWLSGGPSKLSAVTVASLADMGYAVDPTGAESFVAPTAAGAPTIGGAVLSRSAGSSALGERLTTPRFRIGRDGVRLPVQGTEGRLIP